MSDDNKDFKPWQLISTDLKKALDDWETYTRQPIEMNPDEKKLKDMQRLILELKNKLIEFEQKK